jgi:hypothetical protein
MLTLLFHQPKASGYISKAMLKIRILQHVTKIKNGRKGRGLIYSAVLNLEWSVMGGGDDLSQIFHPYSMIS